MYTYKQRISSLILLCVALAGLFNVFVLKESIFGLAPKSVAIISFIPLVIIVLMIGRVKA